MASVKTIAISLGDPEGVGPEILMKAWKRRRELPAARWVVFGPPGILDSLASHFERVTESALTNLNTKKDLYVSPNSGLKPKGFLGARLAGWYSGWAIEAAFRFIQTGAAGSLVTCPISKERIRSAGFPFFGHTDFLSALCGNVPVTMMLTNARMSVALVTVHCPLKDVAIHVTPAAIRLTVENGIRHLLEKSPKRAIRIAVLGLNPHAGEGGEMGKEEESVISPVLKKIAARYSKLASITGPHPADSFFTKKVLGRLRPDLIVAMYHDQGLGPLKCMDFENTVNVTLGLPFLRTSVDHGTAFDIAGKGIADPSSLLAAIRYAISHEVRQKIG